MDIKQILESEADAQCKQNVSISLYCAPLFKGEN
jgi:hypothetical protein